MAVVRYRCSTCKEETAVVVTVLRIDPVIPCPYCNAEAKHQPETTSRPPRLRHDICPVRWSSVSRRTPAEGEATA